MAKNNSIGRLSIEDRVSRLEELVIPEAEKKRKREERAARNAAQRAHAAAAVAEQVRAITPQGWEVLDEDYRTYGSDESLEEAIQEATKKWGSRYEIRVVPGLVAEHGDNGPTTVVHSEWDYIVFGKRRKEPLAHKCPCCNGAGWVGAKPEANGRAS